MTFQPLYKKKKRMVLFLASLTKQEINLSSLCHTCHCCHCWVGGADTDVFQITFLLWAKLIGNEVRHKGKNNKVYSKLIQIFLFKNLTHHWITQTSFKHWSRARIDLFCQLMSSYQDRPSAWRHDAWTVTNSRNKSAAAEDSSASSSSPLFVMWCK